MYAVGIDLGGTFVKTGVVTDKYELLSESVIPTQADRPYGKVISDMSEEIRRVVAQAGLSLGDISGVGVGSPGAVDAVRGEVLFAANLGWSNVPLAESLAELIDVPGLVVNDAQAAVLGESVAGAGIGCDNLVMLTLGTGVGGGIIAGGKLVSGGEVGHMVIRADGEMCNCGRRGCLEAYASATAVIREVQRAIAREPQSPLAKMCSSAEQIDAKLMFDAADRGDDTAREIERNFIAALGEGIANLINLLRLDKVLLGGGISSRGERLIEPLSEFVKAHAFAGDRLPIPPIQQGALGNSAGVIGAASLVLG